jgi:hypothetical protein
MASGLDTTPPVPTVPVFNVTTGILDIAWYRFFLALWARGGGGTGTLGLPGGVNGNVQFNQSGAFGGYTRVQLTGQILPFGPSVAGAVPASGGGSTNFLRADGVFAAPILTGTAGGDLAGTYPNPTVAKINGATLGSTVDTAGNLLIGSGTGWVSHPVTGDATINAAGAVTFGTVNATTGSFGDATHVGQFTVNAKGLTTAAAAVLIAIPAPLFGTTGARPTLHTTGTIYFDTTLVIPIWWSGANWVNATGATV